MMNTHKNVYKIKIRPTNNENKWYYSREGRIFDASLFKRDKKMYYKIDDIHKIPAVFAELIQIERVELQY